MERNENGFPICRPAQIRRNGCIGTPPPEDTPLQLAMVYAPMSSWRKLYTPEDALCHGTLFEELYKPLEGHGVKAEK